jgi:hypothetical protein
MLFIDRAAKHLRRVHRTVNGLESTRGEEVDGTFRSFRNIGGIVWPTDFDARIRVPCDLHADYTRRLGLNSKRGLRAAELTIAGFKGRAAKPSASLPAR